jgi:CelD/BcsL family acetyltransferase involved in cellulose biosynthesis
MLTTTELNRIDDFNVIRAVWHRLWDQTARATFFQTPEWIETVWRHFPDPQKLRVILVKRRGEIVGIVPFCVRTVRRKVGALRTLTYPLNDWGTFFGPIGPQPGTAFRAAMRHIRSTPRDWDLIDLCWIDEAANEFLDVGLAMREARYGFLARPRMEVRLCRIDGDWEAFVARQSHNWRRQMRRDAQQLEQVGEVRLLRYRPEAGGVGTEPEHFEIYQLCEEIAKKSWQADAESQSTLCSPRVRKVLLPLHRHAAALGMLDVAVLLVGDRPAAFFYNYAARGHVYGLRMGYDPAPELAGAGKILLYRMIEDSFRRGDVEYCFGPGRQPYKDRFATEMRHAYTFRHYARGAMRSQLLHLRERIYERLISPQAIVEKGLVT